MIPLYFDQFITTFLFVLNLNGLSASEVVVDAGFWGLLATQVGFETALSLIN